MKREIFKMLTAKNAISNGLMSQLIAMNPFEEKTVRFDCVIHGLAKGYVRKSDSHILCEKCMNEERIRKAQKDKFELKIKEIGLGSEHLNCTINPDGQGNEYVPDIMPNTTFETNEEVINITRVKAWIKHFSYTSNGFLMAGNTGTGKTHILAAIAKAIVNKGFSCRYFTAKHIENKLEATRHWSSPLNEQDVINTLAAYDLLLIDDIGATKTEQKTEGAMTELFDKRYSSKKTTILVSNLSPDKVKSVIGDRAYSRNCQSILIFSGRDRREEKNKAW